MHELSLAHGIVEQAAEAARAAQAERVVAVHLKVGRLAGIEAGALLFCYEIASQGTLLEGSRLEIEDVPLVVWCAHCLEAVELAGIQSFRCPTCQTPCGEIRQGRELQIESLEVEP
jgi:hydrogenase nickel incorporation protein HypA/HybF